MKKIVFLMVGVLLLTGAGCGKSQVQKTIQKLPGGEGEIKYNKNGDMLEAKTDDGSIKIGDVKEMPELWPKEIPNYPDAVLQMTSVMGADPTASGSGMSVTSATKDSPEKVADFYKKELAAGGWTVDGEFSYAQMITITASKSNQEFSLSISSDGEETSITMILGNQ